MATLVTRKHMILSKVCCFMQKQQPVLMAASFLTTGVFQTLDFAVMGLKTKAAMQSSLRIMLAIGMVRGLDILGDARRLAM